MIKINVDQHDGLSLAAVGLWHKLHYLHGNVIDDLDVLTAHPNPDAWGPFNEQTDLEAPMDELKAIGYAQENGNQINLYEWMEFDD